MSVVGVGLDVVDLDRFAKLYDPDDNELLGRCFTVEELHAVSDGSERLARLAARFAAKEAVLKVIGGLKQGLALTDIEIVSHGSSPELKLHREAEALSQSRGIVSWHISLTHSATSAAAVAVASR